MMAVRERDFSFKALLLFYLRKRFTNIPINADSPVCNKESYVRRFIVTSDVVSFVDILPRLKLWDSLDFPDITSVIWEGYSQGFQNLSSVGFQHLCTYFPDERLMSEPFI